MIKPILFNTDMVRAILDNCKTVTRRVVKPQPFEVKQQESAPCWCGHFVSASGKILADRPPYHPGDILYVREAWAKLGATYFYRADKKIKMHSPGMWRPSIHMPREAARIFLRMTAVRVERLQDITEAQAVAEGFEPFPYEPAAVGFVETWEETLKPADRALYGWDANPWVWVVEFERISGEEAMAHAWDKQRN